MKARDTVPLVNVASMKDAESGIDVERGSGGGVDTDFNSCYQPVGLPYGAPTLPLKKSRVEVCFWVAVNLVLWYASCSGAMQLESVLAVERVEEGSEPKPTGGMDPGWSGSSELFYGFDAFMAS